MNKIKVIDLLNKIANGEEVPKLIKYDNEKYKITKVLLEDNNYYYNYINEDMECIFPVNTNRLNDEVEILEEEKKIPDEININLAYIDKEYLLDKEDIDRKINEIINRHNILVDKVSDYLKSKGE